MILKIPEVLYQPATSTTDFKIGWMLGTNVGGRPLKGADGGLVFCGEAGSRVEAAGGVGLQLVGHLHEEAEQEGCSQGAAKLHHPACTILKLYELLYMYYVKFI